MPTQNSPDPSLGYERPAKKARKAPTHCHREITKETEEIVKIPDAAKEVDDAEDIQDHYTKEK